MSMVSKATATLERLTKVRMTAEGAEEVKALESLRRELSELAAPIKSLAIIAASLRAEEVGFSSSPELASVRDNLLKAHERFQQVPKATTLQQGSRWTNLTKKLESLAEKGRVSLTSDWQQYFDDHFFSGLPPVQQEAKMDRTPQNTQSLQHYRTLYQAFIKYRHQPPTKADEFENLRSLSHQLGQIAFTNDAPKDVRKFLDAISGGANLELLTTEVLTWLQNKQMLSNYVVRARVN